VLVAYKNKQMLTEHYCRNSVREEEKIGNYSLVLEVKFFS